MSQQLELYKKYKTLSTKHKLILEKQIKLLKEEIDRSHTSLKYCNQILTNTKKENNICNQILTNTKKENNICKKFLKQRLIKIRKITEDNEKQMKLIKQGLVKCKKRLKLVENSYRKQSLSSDEKSSYNLILDENNKIIQWVFNNIPANKRFEFTMMLNNTLGENILENMIKK